MPWMSADQRNEWHDNVWRRRTAQMWARLEKPYLAQIAGELIASDIARRVAVNLQHSFEGAALRAEAISGLMESHFQQNILPYEIASAKRAQASRGGKKKSTDALGLQILAVLADDPSLSEKEVV